MQSFLDDSRWLQLEVCREFQRSKCSRSDTECKFAHPPPNVEVQNGRVIACYDSIKGRCNREKPPCKYFHPPQHLKDQLLINGRNHLALKNALMLQMGMSPGQAVLPGQIPTIASPYLAGVPQLGGPYNPYVSASPMLQVVTSDATGVTSQLGVVSGAGYPAPGAKMQRSDRIEAYPGMVQYKRSAADKTAMMYQPTAGASAAAAAAAYQQAHALMQLQQPFVPVSCEYSGAAISAASSTTSSSASIASSSSTATNSSASSSSFPYASASISSSSVSYSNAKTVSYSANPSVVLTNGSATAAFEVVNSATRSDENTTTAESNRKDSENATDDSLPGPSVVSNVSSALKRPHSTTPTSSSAIAYSSAPIPTLYSTTPTSMYIPGSIANQSALAYTGVSLNKHVASAAAAATNTQTNAAHPSVAAMQQYVNPYALLSAQTQINPYAGALAGNPLLGGFPGVAGFQAVTPGQANAAAAQQHLAALQFNNSYAGLAGLYATPGALSLGGMASLGTPSVLPPYVGLGVPSAAAAAAAAAAAMGGMNQIRGVPTAVPNVGAVAHPAAAVAALTNSAGLQPYKKMRTM